MYDDPARVLRIVLGYRRAGQLAFTHCGGRCAQIRLEGYCEQSKLPRDVKRREKKTKARDEKCRSRDLGLMASGDAEKLRGSFSADSDGFHTMYMTLHDCEEIVGNNISPFDIDSLKKGYCYLLQR